MTIVADHNINGAYWKKRNMYNELKNKLNKETKRCQNNSSSNINKWISK